MFFSDVGCVLFPAAVHHDVADLRVLRRLCHPRGVPGTHVAGRANRALTVKHRLQSLCVLLQHVLHQVLRDLVDVQRKQNSLAQRLLVKQRRNVDFVGRQKLFYQPHQLEQQIFALAFELVLQRFKGTLRGFEHQPLQAKLLRQLFQVDAFDLAPVGCASHCGRNVSLHGDGGRVNGQRLHIAPLHHQLRAHHLVHAQDVGPLDLMHIACAQ